MLLVSYLIILSQIQNYEGFTPMCYSKIFMVLVITFRCLNYFELIFAYGVK